MDYLLVVVFQMVSDMLSTPQTLCGNDSPCVWGDAVNVRNKYIYVTQPTLNRIVVIEIEDRSNPVEVTSYPVLVVLYE